jgi:type VI secretion system ImpM family protein
MADIPNFEKLELSLFGKVPARGDFIRVQVRGLLPTAFDRWLVSALAELGPEDFEGFQEPINFMYGADPSQGMLLGTMRPSRDKAGRSFPIAAFCEIPRALLSTPWGALVLAFEPALSTAAEFLRSRADQADPDQLAVGAASIILPDREALRAAVERSRAHLASNSALDWLFSSCGSGDAPALAYALSTFRTACQNAGAGASTAAITVDTPAADSTALAWWLDCAQRWTTWSENCVNALWRPGLKPALIALGGLPVRSLKLLLDANRDDPNLWPLVTSSEKASSRAFSNLSLAIRSQLESREGALTDLLAKWSTEI